MASATEQKEQGYSGVCARSGGGERLACSGLAFESCGDTDGCEWQSYYDADGHLTAAGRRAMLSIALVWLCITLTMLLCIKYCCIVPRRRQQLKPSPGALIIASLLCLFLPLGPLLMWLPFASDCCYRAREPYPRSHCRLRFLGAPANALLCFAEARYSPADDFEPPPPQVIHAGGTLVHATPVVIAAQQPVLAHAVPVGTAPVLAHEAGGSVTPAAGRP